MTPDPDVTPVGFAATASPDAPLRRVRNPLWLLAAVVVAVASLAGIGWFVALQVAGAPGEGDAVATGRVAALGAPEAAVTRFTAEAGKHTVWLDTSGIVNDRTRETVVAATNCEARYAAGGSARFRGAIQGSNVTIGDKSTVGVFDAPAGGVTVTCAQQRFGRRRGLERLRTERAFLVVPGDPGVGWAPWVTLFTGSFALFGVPALVGRWRGGRLRAR